MSFRKMPIWIALQGGFKRQVPAHVKGVFAAHQDGCAWTVTHVPTGFAIRKNLVHVKVAKQIIAAIEGFPEWAQIQKPDDVKDVPGFRDKVMLAMESIDGISIEELAGPFGNEEGAP